MRELRQGGEKARGAIPTGNSVGARMRAIAAADGLSQQRSSAAPALRVHVAWSRRRASDDCVHARRRDAECAVLGAAAVLLFLPLHLVPVSACLVPPSASCAGPHLHDVQVLRQGWRKLHRGVKLGGVFFFGFGVIRGRETAEEKGSPGGEDCESRYAPPRAPAPSGLRGCVS